MQWSQTSGVSNSFSDGAASVAIDNSGNIIVAGNVVNVATLKDIRSIKYNVGGNQIWSRDYTGLGDNTDKVNAMDVDASGNSYMCGSTYSSNNKTDMCVVKVDALGNLVWTRTYDGTGHSTDNAVAVKVDASGNVYVAGYVKDSVQGYNYCTLKYDNAGVLLWAKQFNNLANNSDQATAMTINSAGEVFVTGESDIDPSSSNNKDIATVKYSPSGTQLWVMNFGGTANLNDKPYAIGLSPAGDVVVAGKIAQSSTDDDAVVLKYNSTGSLLWSYTYTSNLGNDAAVAMAQDASGDIGVAMSRTNAAGNTDICFGHLDAAGNDLGIVSYDGIGNGNDNPSAIVFDNSGNAFITGQTDVDPTIGTANYDIVTIKYNSLGAQQWVKTYAGPAGDDDNGVAIDIDNSTGYVYVAAQSQDGTLSAKNNDILVLQYDPAGNQHLFGIYDGTTRSDGPAGIIVTTNDLYVAGTSVGPNNNQKDMVMLLYSTFEVGISTSENTGTISVFPNPCSTFTEIHFDNTAQQRNISLVDVNGKVVFNDNSNEETVRLETDRLSKGIYFGTVSEEGKTTQHFKVVVQ